MGFSLHRRLSPALQILHQGLPSSTFPAMCKMLPEKETLLDKAKEAYHTLLQEGISTAKALGASAVESTEGVILPEGGC